MNQACWCFLFSAQKYSPLSEHFAKQKGSGVGFERGAGIAVTVESRAAEAMRTIE